MMEVFKTNVADGHKASFLVQVLRVHYPACRINIDLHDCDRILRVEGLHFCPEQVTTLVRQHGFDCAILPD